MIDNLTYNYGNSSYNPKNQLQSVTDNSGNLTKGFKTAANGSTYTYDNNGNMTADPNKAITNIAYNHLNLPTTITFTSSRSITFMYDAGGNKLRKTVVQSGVTQYAQDYVGGIEYRTASGATTLEAIYHAEGPITTINSALRYEYALKDHLGNTRIMFCDKDGNGVIGNSSTPENSEITQENHYYPYGLGMEGTWLNTPSVSDSKYLYNGKELNDDFGLGLMDYGARFYDAAIGRFPTQDRFTEKYMNMTPYHYAANNPIRYIDVNGDSIGVELNQVNGKDVYTFTITGKVINETSENYTDAQMEAIKNEVIDGLKETYNGESENISFNLKTNISVVSEANPLTSTDHAIRIVDDGKIPKKDPATLGTAEFNQNFVYVTKGLLEKKEATTGKYAGTGLTEQGEESFKRTVSHKMGHSAGLHHAELDQTTKGNIMHPGRVKILAGKNLNADQVIQVYNDRKTLNQGKQKK